MLKLTYTENSFHLEYLTQSLEEWVTTRVLLAVRTGTTLSVEPSAAAFLLPLDLPYVADLKKLVQQEDKLALSICDDELLEVSLEGVWVTSTPENNQGVLVCAIACRTELLLYQIWQEVPISAFVVNE